MFYQFVLPTSNESIIDDHFIVRVLKDEPYVTLNDTINIVLFIVCTFGIAGNLATVIIFCRLGLKKSSNMLILCLATADAAYLLGISNIPLHVYIRHPENLGFFVSHDSAFFLYMLYHCAVFLETVGKVASLLLPVLIALERIVAVFFPLQFSRILRPDLLKALVVLIFPIGIPVYVCYCMLVKFVYRNDSALNVTAGVVLRSDDYANALERYRLIVEVYITLCGPVCTGIVISACVAVGAKVRMQMKERCRLLGASKRNPQNRSSEIIKNSSPISLNTSDATETRKPDRSSPVQKDHLHARLCTDNTKPLPEEFNAKITSKKQARPSGVFAIFSFGLKASKSSKSRMRDVPFKIRLKATRTTKILMSVCVFYSLNGLYGFLSFYIVRTLVPNVLAGVVVHRVSILIMCLNSGINFFIYAFFNSNFRKQYKEMFCRCARIDVVNTHV